MARPYRDDLRRKLLEAHERGEGSLAQLAKRFRVSEGWAEKISDPDAYRLLSYLPPPNGWKKPASEPENGDPPRKRRQTTPKNKPPDVEQ